MFIKQFVDEGLGNSSYLLGSEKTGLAVVIDAQRDVDRYRQITEGLGLRLTHALDTHLHADFVSGARELAAQSGVIIGASATAQLAFEHLPLTDATTISLGDLTIGVMTTPGHSPEHISFIVTENRNSSPSAVFTGGALMVGGAARTDLLGADLTEPLARELYHTLHGKLLQLPDAVAVYPTHGAGSFCAAPSSPERTTTIGKERQWNYLARATSEEEFVQLATSGLPLYPTYYRFLRALNQRGARILNGLPQLEPLSPQELHQKMNQGIAVVDTRVPRDFAAGHIPGAYGIPLGAPLITWAGWVLPFAAPIILIADDAGDREEAVRQLIRIGYDDLRGYLDGGIAAWKAASLPIAQVRVMSAEELQRQLESGLAPKILDVRHDSEWDAGHLPGAIHIDAGELPAATLPFALDEQVVVHCHVGDRSTISVSLLERRGYDNLQLLDGGFSDWQASGREIVRADAIKV
jgi:hydroxyacylglutathione hydrolase